MSDEQPSSPIHSEDEIKTNNNDTNVVVRRERPSRACTARSAARIYEAAVAEAAVVTVRKQKPRRRPRREVEEDEEEEEEPPPSPPNPYSDIITPLVSEPESSQLPRWEIRSMWELASVLNFLNVFRPLLNIKVEFSVEELETALISPNNTLGEVHIPLLKAIPPVTRMALGQNTWVTVLCRKLRDWWHWVSEGELPIVASHGTEIDTYKTLDPRVRVVILKALCDIRVEQDDIRSYIDDSIKHGVPLSAFCKERTGGDSHGVSYWYEDDPIIGQRLYREIRKVEVKKGKGKTVISIPSYQWETVSTNLDEFQDVSEKLFCSKNRTESSLGKKLKIDMLPEIEKVQKRKEKLLKKQHRQALLLDGMIVDGLGGRSLRGRKQVSYTFDDYDRSINEAIKITKRKQPSPEPIVRREGLRHENDRWGPPSAPTHVNSTFTPPSPDSLNHNNNESYSDHKSEELDRSNRRRTRPQRYSAREFVEAVSDNEADVDYHDDDDDDNDDDDDDIVGEAVYDEEYLKRKRKRIRKLSSSSEEEEEEGDEEYKWEGDDNVEEEEDEFDSLNASEDDEEEEEEDSDRPKKFKKLSGRTSHATKLRSVNSGPSPRRSRRATRNRIDYKKYEFSESEPESGNPETSNSFGQESESESESEPSGKRGFEMGSSDENESENNNNDNNNDNNNNNNDDHDHDDDDDDNDDGNGMEIDDDDDGNEEMKIEESVIEEKHGKIEKEEEEEENGRCVKLDESPVEEDEFENGATKRRFLDLNELAPGSGFEDGSIKDDDTDNF